MEFIKSNTKRTKWLCFCLVALSAILFAIFVIIMYKDVSAKLEIRKKLTEKNKLLITQYESKITTYQTLFTNTYNKLYKANPNWAVGTVYNIFNLVGSIVNENITNTPGNKHYQFFHGFKTDRKTLDLVQFSSQYLLWFSAYIDNHKNLSDPLARSITEKFKSDLKNHEHDVKLIRDFFKQDPFELNETEQIEAIDVYVKHNEFADSRVFTDFESILHDLKMLITILKCTNITDLFVSENYTADVHLFIRQFLTITFLKVRNAFLRLAVDIEIDPNECKISEIYNGLNTVMFDLERYDIGTATLAVETKTLHSCLRLFVFYLHLLGRSSRYYKIFRKSSYFKKIESDPTIKKLLTEMKIDVKDYNVAELCEYVYYKASEIINLVYKMSYMAVANDEVIGNFVKLFSTDERNQNLLLVIWIVFSPYLKSIIY